jgi:hypothetical protein
MQRYRDQQAHGIALHPGILPSLQPWAKRLGVGVPDAGR